MLSRPIWRFEALARRRPWMSAFVYACVIGLVWGTISLIAGWQPGGLGAGIGAAVLAFVGLSGYYRHLQFRDRSGF